MRILTSRTRALIGFAALGVWWGAFGAALPAIQGKADAGDAELGLGLLLLGLGALVSMRATGVLMDRAGPVLTPVAIGLFGVTGLLPALADSPTELYVFLLVVGATSGSMDAAQSRVWPSPIWGSSPPFTHITNVLPHGSRNAALKPLNSAQ